MNRFAVLLSCCLMLAGCVGARLETPHLTVAGVELLKGDLLQQNLRVRLHRARAALQGRWLGGRERRGARQRRRGAR